MKKPSAKMGSVAGGWNHRISEWFFLNWREMVIFVVSISVSALVLFTGRIDPCPPGSDASFYAMGGENVARILKNLPEFLSGFLNKTYTIQDYARMGFVDPSGIATIFRAPSYDLYLGFVVLLFGSGPLVFLFSQMVILAFVFVTIYQMLKNRVHPKLAMGVTLTAMLYPAFYLSAQRPESELFLMLSILICCRLGLKAVSAPSLKLLFATGFMLIFIGGIKSSMQYFFLPFMIAGVFLIYRAGRAQFKPRLLSFFTGMLVPLLLMSFLYTRTNGKFGFTESGLGGRNLYFGQIYDTDCFFTQGCFQNKWYVEEARKLSSFDQNTWFVKHSELGTTAFSRNLKDDFLRFVVYTAKKSFLLISHPHSSVPLNGPFRVMQGEYQGWFHLLLLAVSFTFLIFGKNHLDLKVLYGLFFIYNVGIHSVSNPDTRYFIPMVPFYFVFTGLLIKDLAGKGRLKSVFIPFVGVIAVAGVMSFSWPLLFGDYIYSYIVKIVCVNLLLVLLLAAIWRIAKHGSIAHRIVAGLTCTYLLFSLEVLMATDKYILRTSIGNGGVIEQEIILQQHDFARYASFYLMIDADDVAGWKLTLNGRQLAIPPKGGVSPVVYAAAKEWNLNEPQWRFIKVPMEFLQATNRVAVSAADGLVINADYVSGRITYLPSHIYYLTNLQMIYGYVRENMMDKRAYLPAKLASSRNATLMDGVPSGKRARIFLLGKLQGGYYIDSKYGQLSQALPSYLSLLRLIDRGILRYKLAPDRGDVPAEGALLNQIMGDMSVFFVGYELF